MPSGTILVVEASPETERRLGRLPAAEGLKVERVTSAGEAVAYLQERSARLVLAGTADTNGRLAGLVEAANGAPVIVSAGQGSVRGAVEAMQEGAFDYLVQPCAEALLDAAVRRALVETTAGPTPGAITGRDKPIVCADRQMRQILEVARNVADSDATVLILGESGTGKELLAAEIHRCSPRRGGAYVTTNCAALPETLAESELFGHEKGAFTGALTRRPGKFEQAEGGTLLLDEISELPPGLQAKLLRVIQEREVDRVGGTRPVPVDVRLVAISNVDLNEAVASGRFRADLFYRINVVPLALPPLRRRPDDIAPLAEHFLQRHAARHGRPMRRLDPRALDRLKAHPWPGNVRELEHAIERAVLVGRGDTLLPEYLLLGDAPQATEEGDAAVLRPGLSVRDMEARLVDVTLRHVNGNRQQAAEMLGISIRTLRNKLNAYKRQGVAPTGAEGAAAVAGA
jgi:two-component system response regulator FlrC